jgi:hypothetical protein
MITFVKIVHGIEVPCSFRTTEDAVHMHELALTKRVRAGEVKSYAVTVLCG